MTDLVKKCRDVAYESRSHDGESEALNDAADEIERLRALHLERTKLTTKALNERDQNAAEIGRLRRALVNLKVRAYELGQRELHDQALEALQTTAGEGQKR